MYTRYHTAVAARGDETVPLTSVKYVPADAKTVIIEIESYEFSNPVGLIKNPTFGRKIPFRSATELLMIVDELMNSLSFPQATMHARSFAVPPRNIETSERVWGTEPIAVFKLNVVFRHNASWQGTLTWLENEEQMPFRSAFEMLMLVDSVINADAAGKKTKTM
jgi:hypothetical protein